MSTMKKIFYGIATAITLALAGIYIYALNQPDEWAVEHQRTVAAQPDAVYDRLADLERWPSWTSWGPNADESATWTFGENAVGKGASASWNGERLGEGRIVVTRADEAERVEYQLWFAGRDEPTSGVIKLEQASGGTKITWVDRGSVGGNPLLRLLVGQIERQLSDDIERSLIRLDEQL